MALSVAVQVYSVRDFAKEDMRGTLQKIKDMGYAGVEFAGLYGLPASEVKAMCAELGLVTVSAHVPFADMRKDCDKVLNYYAEVGCRYIVVPYLSEADRPGADGWEKTIADISEIGKKAHEKGLTVSLWPGYTTDDFMLGAYLGADFMCTDIPIQLKKFHAEKAPWLNVKY
jgi:sugar phosphate isomerase/epimerase